MYTAQNIFTYITNYYFQHTKNVQENHKEKQLFFRCRLNHSYLTLKALSITRDQSSNTLDFASNFILQQMKFGSLTLTNFIVFYSFLCVNSQHSTPLNYPLITEFQRYTQSPYLKQLNPRGFAEIQFFDFTLQGPTQDDLQFQRDYGQASYVSYSADVIQQDECEYEKSDLSHPHYSNYQSLPLTITYMESSKLNIKAFKTKLKQLKNQHRLYGENQEQIRQFVQSYLTQEDFNKIKEIQQGEINLEQLIKIAQHNLRNVGPISWLQRKVKVQKYMQKKKRRIWNKKINYDCRKKVAENRLRVKGKFVTQQQACNLIGVQQDCSLQYLKQILTKKDKNI